MEGLVCSLKTITVPWLGSSPDSWGTNFILPSLCVLGLCSLILSFLKTNLSNNPLNENKAFNKFQRKTRSRTRNRKRSGAVKACRDCLLELQETRRIMMLLQSHQKKQPCEAKLHQPFYQDPNAVPARDEKPCSKGVEDGPHPRPLNGSTTPLAEHSLPLVSTQSAVCQEKQHNLASRPMGTKWRSSSVGNSRMASPVSSTSDLTSPASPSLFLSWWWERTEALFSPNSSQHQSQQHHLPNHLLRAPFWGEPTDWQVETGNPSFVSPCVQKLLELLILKRVALSMCKDQQKDGSLPQEVNLDHYLNSLNKWLKSLGVDSTVLTSFHNRKDKKKQLPRVQHLSYPRVLGDISQEKCHQFFWGLPSLHSESLLATALVPWSMNQMQAPSVLFNGISNSVPGQNQISKVLPLYHSRAQQQSKPRKTPQLQATPLPPVQTPVQFAPTQTIQLLNSPSLASHYGIDRPLRKTMRQSCVPMKIEPLEDSKKHLEKLCNLYGSLTSTVPLCDQIRNLKPIVFVGGNKLCQDPHWTYLETLNVHLSKKIEQIREGLVPVSIRRSCFLASCNAAKARSTHTQQELKGHTIRLRVRQKWGLNLRGAEPPNHQPLKSQPYPLP